MAQSGGIDRFRKAGSHLLSGRCSLPVKSFDFLRFPLLFFHRNLNSTQLLFAAPDVTEAGCI